MADNEKTITIKLETKQAEKNTDKLGNQIKKTKGEAQGFSGVLTKQGKGIGSLMEGYIKFLGPLAAVAAAFKLGKAAISSNINLTLALDKANAGLSAVLAQVTADIGNWIEKLTNGGRESNFFAGFIQRSSEVLIGMAQSLGQTGEEIFNYTQKLVAAENAGRELVQVQFEIKEAMLINRIEISEARQELELFRLASRDANATEAERFQSQKLAIEQVKVLRAEREDELAIRQREIDALKEAAAGSADLYQVRLKQHELDKDSVELQTSLIMLENTLTERLNTLQNAYVKYLDTQSKEVDEQEEFDMSIFDSNLTIQQATQTTDLAAQANEKLAESINSVSTANVDNTDSQEGYNLTLQTSYGILNQMVNLFKNFNFSSLMSLLFSGLQIAGNFVGGGAASGFLGKVLGFKDGGIVRGPDHSHGGVKFNIGGVVNELEGGEAVINKRSMSVPWVRDLASQLNQVGGGVKFAQGGPVSYTHLTLPTILLV